MSSGNMKRCVVLDAMGVMFEAADDVAKLLAPFVAGHGGSQYAEVRAAYLQASLGTIGPDQFWARVGVSPDLEDAYLERHRLSDGLLGFLEAARSQGLTVWCLSNDVGRWAAKLRARFRLDAYLAGSIISSEVGIRKPDSRIYRRLVVESGYRPDEMILIDDRKENAAAARRLGIESKLFDAHHGFGAVARTVLADC